MEAEARGECDGGADDVGRLRGHVDGELVGRPVEVGDRPARLDRRGVRARIVHLDLRHEIGLGEGPVGAFGVADLPVEDLVVGLVLLVVADEGLDGGVLEGLPVPDE